MIKTILVATDASAHARKAVKLASEMAYMYSARLVIVHALLRDATSAILRKVATRKALTKDQRALLDTYETAAQIAAARGGGMSLGWTAAPAELLEPIGRQIIARAEQDAYAADVRKVAGFVLPGNPAEAILAAAKREKADIIVLGTRGFGELKGLLLGSVSHKVAARATCPVVTVK